MRYTDKKKYNVDEIKQQCDLVLSFDPKDCETYAFTYYPSVFSSFTGEIIDMPDSDVYLLAKAKNRLKDIYDVYDLLRYHNLKVDLNLVGVDKTKRRFEGEIHYWDGKGMSYIENLQHVLHTKCILEIMQKGGTGYTLRTCEAVCLGKKLLTNNPYVKETPFFRSDYISAFTSSNDMDMDFIRGIKDTCNIDYNYKDKMSPIGLLKFIEDRIS